MITEKPLKFGIQNGLNVARAGYTEDQILTACMLADKTGYDSIFYLDHTNVPQWKNEIVLDSLNTPANVKNNEQFTISADINNYGSESEMVVVKSHFVPESEECKEVVLSNTIMPIESNHWMRYTDTAILSCLSTYTYS